MLHNSLLEPIVGGFEHLETWGIDRGIPWFNYGVEWTDRMPIHAHFTYLLHPLGSPGPPWDPKGEPWEPKGALGPMGPWTQWALGPMGPWTQWALGPMGPWTPQGPPGWGPQGTLGNV